MSYMSNFDDYLLTLFTLPWVSVLDLTKCCVCILTQNCYKRIETYRSELYQTQHFSLFQRVSE